MAQQVGKFAAQKLLRQQMKNYQSKKVETGDDPYFALIEDPKRPGRQKKVKKQIPAYIPEHDAMILARVRKSAYRLDMCLFDLLGIRFGWEAVIGLIPAAGDAVGMALAYLVFRECCKVDGGLPAGMRLHMLINIIVDFAVGLIPFVGDLVDAAFKCNTRNLRLLEVHLDKKYKPSTARGRDERDLVGVDREKRHRDRASGIFHPQDPPPATAFEDFSEGEDEGRYGRGHSGGRGGGGSGRGAQPQRSRTADDRRGSWFTGGRPKSGKARPPQSQPSQPPMSHPGGYPTRQETGSGRG